tara:strand:+ start:54 stop:641 length:588 start_codon:yes stop_codon:yes gene_type:complete
MEIIIHKINSIKMLKKIPNKFGTEIDIRAYKSNLILSHDPKKKGDKLSTYLREYNHGTLIMNIKEAGIEHEAINLAKKFKIKSFFLLDVEQPFVFKSKSSLKKYLSVRFSEFETIETAIKFKKFTNWIWIDTINTLPINNKNLKIIKKFNSCIVSPERWKRQNDIKKYINYFKKINFKPSAVMTDMKRSSLWELW